MNPRPDPDRLLELLGGFSGLPVIVYGDLVLDEYLQGEIRRVSREAPVLILDHTETVYRPGGGANAVQNLHRLGAGVVPIGVVGNDPSGDRLLDVFREMGVETGEVVVAPRWTTPTKTRIFAGLPQSPRQQVLRVDRGRRGGPAADGVPIQLLGALRRRTAAARGLLISDYGYGAVREEDLPALLGVARRARLRVTADSRHGLGACRGITAATPNLEELEEAAGIAVGTDEEALRTAGTTLRERIGADALLVTLGGRGMALFEAGAEGPVRIPALGPRDPVDVTGAGDTVISAFSLGVLAGGTFLEAAWLASHAAGIAVMKRGTATVDPEEIRASIRGSGEARR
ncbi:MAG: hypothetical protein HY509_03740 [Acidobacteria bacterium]|nr:hypothetical protein [Acidobacteriota bacterium]